MISKMYCTKCGHEGISIVRPGRQREPGHLKKLYCVNCKEEVNHVEIKEKGAYNYTTFWYEYTLHNFDEEGNRKLPWRQFMLKARKEGELNG
jgi:hypothetical protein